MIFRFMRFSGYLLCGMGCIAATINRNWFALALIVICVLIVISVESA
jgi:hypothetical protein